MLLDQGRIAEFDRYVFDKNISLGPTHISIKTFCAASRPCFEVLFAVQSDRQRGVCNVEENGWSVTNIIHGIHIFLSSRQFNILALTSISRRRGLVEPID